MHRMRRFHTSAAWLKIPSKNKVTASKSGVSSEVAIAAQNLRMQLSDKGAAPLKPLMSLAHAVQNSTEKIPISVYRLMKETLDTTPNYRGALNGADLQQLFRAVSHQAKPGQVELITKLYADIYRHSKLTGSQKLENGIVYYKVLRSQGMVAEAEQLVESLLKSNKEYVTPATISEILRVTGEFSPCTSSVLTVMKSFSSTDSEVLAQAIALLLTLKSPDGLDQLAELIYFTNAHYRVPDETAIVLLDAFLQLPVYPNAVSATIIPTGAGTNSAGSGGSKVLKLCLSKLNGKTSLEVLELLLMSSIHFQIPVPTAKPVYLKLLQHKSQYTKESWDVIAQWTAYSSSDVLSGLKTGVLSDMPREFIDCKTLVSILIAASEKAQCGESQVNEIVEYFDVELGVTPDASVYHVLIRRALQAVEVNKARTLFLQSNTDWNIDNDKYLDVLNDLLVALCRTTSIPRQTVVNTYQRVQIFAPKLSYKTQLAMLEMFLHESQGGSLVPAGVFLAEQFGENPDLAYDGHKEIFELLYHRLLVTDNEEMASEMCVLLNSTIILPYEAYYPICYKMCQLNRPDVAHLFFRQLRNRAKTGSIRPPGEEIYLLLFAEYAKWKYELGIHELDKYFRLDVNNEMTVPMLNRIMAGYSALQDSHKMAYLWTEVSSLPRGTKHGPNDETMCIWIQFLGRNLSIEAVDDVWESLPSEFRLKPTQNTLKQYIVANCYHGYYTRALDVVKMAPVHYGVQIDGEILQALYNWTLLPNRKEEVREFALTNYSKEWAELEISGKLKNVLLPEQNQWGDTDEYSRRWEAIKQLESQELALTK